MDASYTGNKISQLRKQHKMTQKELAFLLSVTDKAVSKWERGRNFPDLMTMEKIAEVLHTSVVELLGLEQHTNEQVAAEISDLASAEKHLRDALVYPENLGEGKLEGCLDNDIYYELGITLRETGRENEAVAALTLATRGDSEPCGVMYYNDQPAHHIFYKGLAFSALGETKEAAKCFAKLLDYGERHLRDSVKIDYFAVSLPDFVIFDEDYTEKNRGHCNYLMGLAKLGTGDLDAARKFLCKASEIEPCHIMSRVMRERYGI